MFQESHCRLIQPTDPAVLSELTWRQEGGWVRLFMTFFLVRRDGVGCISRCLMFIHHSSTAAVVYGQ